MNQVPREEFVRRSERDLAYADEALPIEAGQTISQPYIVARMTELLAPRAGDRVLEIGTGSGYQAAILAVLGAAVLTIERQPELAALARERLARLGLRRARSRSASATAASATPDGAPWDGIIVTAAAPSIPDLAARAARRPTAGGSSSRSATGTARTCCSCGGSGDEWLETNDGPCVFVPLVGAEGFPG